MQNFNAKSHKKFESQVAKKFQGGFAAKISARPITRH
jgi:hypothetical protein